MENPFKFGTIVNGPYFTDRDKERAMLENILNSPNHAVLISPRRFGKSSLVKEVLNNLKRDVISLNLQSITSITKFAEAIYRKHIALHPTAKIQSILKNVRIIPTVSINPITGLPEVTFQPNVDKQIVLEDALNLVEKHKSRERAIVVLDEFQEILKIEKGLDRILRSIMQEHNNINYILMGSQEDMMKKIFLRKKSPFYHFGSVIYLDKIPKDDFSHYVSTRLERLTGAKEAKKISEQILSFTQCHPYYTQQLAFQTWFSLQRNDCPEMVVESAIEQIVTMHDFDYSRLWETMNLTNKTVLLRLATGDGFPMKNAELPTSTVFSSLKRLVGSGIVLKNGKYTFDDPFFKLWVLKQL